MYLLGLYYGVCQPLLLDFSGLGCDCLYFMSCEVMLCSLFYCEHLFKHLPSSETRNIAFAVKGVRQANRIRARICLWGCWLQMTAISDAGLLPLAVYGLFKTND